MITEIGIVIADIGVVITGIGPRDHSAGQALVSDGMVWRAWAAVRRTSW